MSSRAYSIDEGTIAVSSSSSSVIEGNSFSVDINTVDSIDIYGVYVKLVFNPDYIDTNQLKVTFDDSIEQKSHFIAVNNIDRENGVIQIMFTLIGKEEELERTSTIGRITFQGLKVGNTAIAIEDSKLLKRDGSSIEHKTIGLPLRIVANTKECFNIHSIKDNQRLVSIIREGETLINIKNRLMILVPEGALPKYTEVVIEELPKVDDGLSAVYMISADKPLTGSIKLSFSTDEDVKTNRHAIYYFNENRNKWVYLGGSAEDSHISLWVDRLAKFIVLENENYKEFNDVTNHWAKEYVERLTFMGVVNGVDDNNFRPSSHVTRAEISKVLGLALALDDENSPLDFTDAEEIPKWAISSIGNLVKKGIIKGYEDNTFRPSSYITRMELAALLSPILAKQKIDSEEILFKDNDIIPNWGKDAIYSMKSLGILEGYEDGTFRPNNLVTRGEMSKVMVILLQLIDII